MSKHQKTMTILETAKSILEAHNPMTLRQLYYQLVSRQVNKNPQLTEKLTKNQGGLVAGMKEEIAKEKIYRLLKAEGALKPGITHILVKHDDGCPAIKTESLADCTCSPNFKLMKTDDGGLTG